ncbi:beta/gamma crystallin-related protein [Novosphingobium sp. BL-8A]|uniref:beta/gamma crystallin-related protein n=1 Tax=Novosphingobium sp. BL-8A TaxID=3127639 RepID=UPI003757E641
MSMRIGRLSVLVATLLLASVDAHSQPTPPRPGPAHPGPPPGAAGQRPDEVIVYRARNFGGPAVSVSRDTSQLGLAWTVGSVRVRGGAWELCELPNYRGTCFTADRDNANLGARRVQSVRSTRSRVWREYGHVDIPRSGWWANKTIRANGAPRLWSVRLCAERSRVQLRNARAYSTVGRYETLHIPSQLAAGACTGTLTFSSRRNVSSVEVSVSAASGPVRLRLEGL